MLAQHQKTKLPIPSIDSETMAFSLFPEHTTDEYKRALICTTYRVIEANPDLTVKTAYWILGRYYDNKTHIDWALTCLSTNVFNCATRWVDPGKNSHYRVKESKKFEDWFRVQVDTNPTLKSFNVHKK